MPDMRLIVAGAGGRMGRALTRAIDATEGAVLTGALEAPGSELLGKDAGLLAGLSENAIKLSADLWSLSKDADGILDFTVPGATIANVAIAAERGLVHIIGTTGLSPSDDAVIKSVTSCAVAPGRGSHDLCPRRAEGCDVGAWQEAGALFDGRRARPARLLEIEKRK